MNRIKKAKRDARQLYHLCLVNGLLDEHRARLVVEYVSTSSGRNRLELLSQFRRLVKFDSDRHTATVENATPLPVQLQESVQAGLSQMYGPGIKTVFSDNPALLGGMRVKIGSDVYDGSVRARLAAVEACFKPRA